MFLKGALTLSKETYLESCRVPDGENKPVEKGRRDEIEMNHFGFVASG